MAKNAEWFKGIFSEASKPSKQIPADIKNREYVVLYKAIMDCIRGKDGEPGENDQGYVRNQFGYNSDNLPSTIQSDNTAGKPEFYSKSELFAVVWNKVLADVRSNVADATTSAVWGVSLAGHRGINGILTPYCSAIEREADEVSFVASKNDSKFLCEIMEPTKVSKGGQKTFTMSMVDFLEVILDKKIPLSLKITETEELPDGVEEPSKTVTRTALISDLHDKFVETYRAKLGKYTAFRSMRLSVGVADIASDLEW